MQTHGIAFGEVQKMRVMDYAVEQGGGDFGVGKNVVPAGEFQVGCNDERLAFVAF